MISNQYITVVLFILLLCLTACREPVRAAAHSDVKLLFASERDGNTDLYAMMQYGSGIKRLTTSTALDSFPVLSPDGEWIAYVRESYEEENRVNNRDIHVMKSDGTANRNLTDRATLDHNPTWSPDAAQLAFASTRKEGKRPGIYRIDVDGSDLTQLTDDGNMPSWSPDGTRIAFVAPSDGQIYLMNSDGSSRRLLLPSVNGAAPATSNGPPLWSPNGEYLLFESNRDGNADIYRARADGSEASNLTDHPQHDAFPVWSPDGKRILFLSTRGGKMDIWVMQADGSSQRNVTKGRLDAFLPVWSPDGNRIAFVSDEAGQQDVYVVRVDGNNLHRLTDNPGQDSFPQWLHPEESKPLALPPASSR